jgi:hypothetical protein
MIGTAPHSLVEPLPFNLSQLGEIIADRETSMGRHIIIVDENCKHRIWVARNRQDSGMAFIIPADCTSAVRMAATQRVERRLLQRADGLAQLPELSPTPFQRRRLALLLRLIDADHAHFTRREMAYSLVYPRHKQLSGDLWKGSNERRRTQRLIDEAMRMMRGGYRELLRS